MVSPREMRALIDSARASPNDSICCPLYRDSANRALLTFGVNAILFPPHCARGFRLVRLERPVDFDAYLIKPNSKPGIQRKPQITRPIQQPTRFAPHRVFEFRDSALGATLPEVATGAARGTFRSGEDFRSPAASAISACYVGCGFAIADSRAEAVFIAEVVSEKPYSGLVGPARYSSGSSSSMRAEMSRSIAEVAASLWIIGTDPS